MTHDFLLEIGCEELPSGAVLPLANQLQANLVKVLEKNQLSFTQTQVFATPRRLAVQIEGLATLQPDQPILRRGPSINKNAEENGLSPAVMGFAKSCGVTVDALKIQDTDKGCWYIYESIIPGKKTEILLPELVNEAVNAISFAKPMRWGRGVVEFARPVHWVLLLLDDKCLSTTILNVKTGNSTSGHRYHAQEMIEVGHPTDYEPLLAKHFVVADFAKRKQLIIEQITQLAEDKSAVAVMPDALIDEVTSIVEYPNALLAQFEQEFLQIPPEVLIASMQVHQKCFALKDSQGNLLPYFVIVSNIKSTNPKQVIAGNEKVMRARLSDAQFFFQQDKKLPLSARIEQTATVIFQAKLGTLKNKAERLGRLMAFMVKVFDLNEAHALRAAELSKCDLMTGMVGEFPELQGLMGYYYANSDHEPYEVAKVLHEHYFPQFAGDILPSTSLGIALSLAERLDTLAGIFAIGQKPTGDKDPFKLRRHGLAVVRLLLEHSTNISLRELINQAILGYSQFDNKAASLQAEIHSFILDRLTSYYQGQGISSDFIVAVKACEDDNLYDLDSRLKALINFTQLSEARALSSACKRVTNLLAKVPTETLEFNPALMEAPAEKLLFERLAAIDDEIQSQALLNDYPKILSNLASLQRPVDQFFAEVMVMVEDTHIKNNRLALLKRLKTSMNQVADISCLQLDASR